MTDSQNVAQDQTATGYHQDGRKNFAETNRYATVDADKTFENLAISPAAMRALVRLLIAVHRKRMDLGTEPMEDI